MSVTINNAMRYIAYICPICFKINREKANAFEISCDYPFILHCSDLECEDDCGAIFKTKDGFKIDLECPVCGDKHTFRLSSAGFLFKSLLVLTCPESNVDIFIIGEKDCVDSAVYERFEG